MSEGDGASGTNELGEHVQLVQSHHVVSRTVGQTLKFFEPMFGSEGLCEVDGEIEKTRSSAFDEGINECVGKKGKGFLDCGFEIFPKKGNGGVDFSRHQLSLSVTHLIRCSIQVKDGEVVGANAGSVTLTVGSGTDESRFSVVDREGIGDAFGATRSRSGLGKNESCCRDDCGENSEKEGSEDFHFFLLIVLFGRALLLFFVENNRVFSPKI